MLGLASIIWRRSAVSECGGYRAHILISRLRFNKGRADSYHWIMRFQIRTSPTANDLSIQQSGNTLDKVPTLSWTKFTSGISPVVRKLSIMWFRVRKSSELGSGCMGQVSRNLWTGRFMHIPWLRAIRLVVLAFCLGGSGRFLELPLG